jgi:hypothetical protein
MEPILLFVLVVFMLLVFLALLSRRPKEEIKMAENNEQTFTFAANGETVMRDVTIIVPEQIVENVPRKVEIDLLALPDLGNVEIPPEKKIDEIVAVVIHPQVRLLDPDQVVYTFKPPLRVTIRYQAADAPPPLSITTVWNDAGQWRFEPRPTEVTAEGQEGGTLYTTIENLQPADPLAVTRP